MTRRSSWPTRLRDGSLVLAAAVFALPVLILVNVSLKPDGDGFEQPFAPPAVPRVANYTDAWSDGVPVSISRALVNSLVITGGSVTALVAIGSLCAYVVARRPSRLATGVYLLFLLSIILPVQLGLVPLFAMAQHLRLTGTYLGMIVLYTGLMMPLAVFLYTGFVQALPREYEEAAQIDGAGVLRTFVSVVFPLMRPITATVAILTGLVIWNDFFTPLVFLGGSSREPLPVAVYSFVGENVTDWNRIFAAIVIAALPILLFALFAQRQLVRSFVSGIKG